MRAFDHWDTLWLKGISLDVHAELISLIKKYSPGKKVLEIGYGTGGDLLELQKSGFKVHGIETSAVAHTWGQKLLGKKEVVLGNGEAMPYANNSFDLIFHQGLLEHFKHPKAFMFEQRRVLQSSGVIVIDVPHTWNVYTVYRNIYQLFGKWYGGWERSYTAPQLKALMSETGFETTEVQYRGIWPHQWGKWLFPEHIQQKQWVLRLLKLPPVRVLQHVCSWIYQHSSLIRLLSSYNIMIVAKKRPLRIGLDARSGEYGGGGMRTYLEELAQAIIKQGDIPVLFCTKKLTLALPQAEVVIEPVRFHAWFWEQIQVLMLINRHGCDLYHATQNSGAPMLTNKPTVLTIQDLIPFEKKEYFANSSTPFLKQLNYRLRTFIAIIKVKKIIVTTSIMAQKVQLLFPNAKEKLNITSLGVSENYFYLQKKLRVKSPDDKIKIILYHGGIAERKNIERLLRAFKQFLAISNQSWKLIITGENEILVSQYTALSQELAISSSIHWTGWVNNKRLEELVQSADIIAYPSEDEGFGMPLLEGMAAGKPVVASNLPVFHLIGKTVPFFFQTNSTEDLTRALLAAKDGISERKKLLGVVLARRYSWSNTFRKTYQLYLSTLAN